MHADAGYRSALTSKTVAAVSDHAASIWGISTGFSSLLDLLDAAYLVPRKLTDLWTVHWTNDPISRSFTSYLSASRTGPELRTSVLHCWYHLTK